MDFFLATIQLLPYNFAPYGWAFCNGQILSIQEYSALFALIGATYGGDGRTTFGLPNLQGAEPIPNMHYCICVDGIYPTRD
jgi:microcystin-dependent protein